MFVSRLVVVGDVVLVRFVTVPGRDGAADS